MICLGIESTAHTFGIGVVTFEGEILANEKSSFTTKSGGMVPNEVADHHNKVKNEVLERALKAANKTMDDISVIAIASAPGLSPCLLVGLRLAKKLAKTNNIPLVAVNHSVSHLTIGNLITGAKHPVYLYVSGPNTQVIALAGKHYRVFGETIDIGLGNMLDKFARELNLGFPGGPIVEKLAVGGNYLELPYSVKGMDVALAGMLTKALRLHEQGASNKDLCFSLQETAFSMLAEVAERAMAHAGKNELLLIGGVAANKRLCKMLETMCQERGAKFLAVPLEYAGDNGVQIAWQGVLQFRSGDKINPDNADIHPYQRIDEVEVFWK